VLQIDAHADLRDDYLGDRHSHACAMRRTMEHAPLVQVGIRNISEAEVKVLPSLKTTIFYDWNMREDPAWIDRAVDALSDDVYISIDLDGIEPGLMPAVGTPEPGGLSWRELTTLLPPYVRAPPAYMRATSSSCARFQEWCRQTSWLPAWCTSCWPTSSA
jgi:agmatinase